MDQNIKMMTVTSVGEVLTSEIVKFGLLSINSFRFAFLFPFIGSAKLPVAHKAFLGLGKF